jgi:hypothetical protein
LARRGIRQLNLSFYGVGCPHPAIECLIVQLNKLLMHYGNQSCMGLKMQNTTELLVIEQGMLLQPFQKEYAAYQHLVTHLWVKLVWEKASCVRVVIKKANLPLHPPRERDSWLMHELVRLNYSSNNLQRLNRVQLHQEVLFLSDIMDASGQTLDRTYLRPKPRDEACSSLSFPIKQPPARDFKLWRETIPQIWAPGGHLHLGDYIKRGHKIWAWQYNLEMSK